MSQSQILAGKENGNFINMFTDIYVIIFSNCGPGRTNFFTKLSLENVGNITTATNSNHEPQGSIF